MSSRDTLRTTLPNIWASAGNWLYDGVGTITFPPPGWQLTMAHSLRISVAPAPQITRPGAISNLLANALTRESAYQSG